MDKTKLWLAIGAIVAVALLGIGLICITLFGINGGWDKDGNGQVQATTTANAAPSPSGSTAAPTPGATPAPTEYVPGEGVLQYQTYAVTDGEAIAQGDTIVATAGEATLNNRELQMYYWMQFYDVWNYFYSQYGSYVPYVINLDYTKPFSQQALPDGSMNWEQYLLETSVNTWHRYQVLAQLAREDGFTLDADLQKQLEDTRAELEASAKENGAANADEVLAEEMGPGVTMDEYMGYMEVYLLGQKYFTKMYDGIVVTDAQLESYFAENQETLGVTKESGNVADVRHILIIPEGGTEVADSPYKQYTDAEWAEGLARAQAVLDEWKSGDATEASFMALTGEYTEDGGYQTNGGLYMDVTKDANYVTNFKNWAIDPNRKAGDCEIVQTEYGYHIMYMVNTEPAWIRFTREAYKSGYCSDVVDNAVKQMPLEVDYSKIKLGTISFE